MASTIPLDIAVAPCGISPPFEGLSSALIGSLARQTDHLFWAHRFATALPMLRTEPVSRLRLSVGIACAVLCLAGCDTYQENSRDAIFYRCVAMARDSHTNDMAASIRECDRVASAMSAFGQDPKGLEAKPASAMLEEGDAQ